MALDPVTAGLDLVNTAINKIWPDKSEQEKQLIAAQVAAVQGQLQINAAEATPILIRSAFRPSGLARQKA